MQEVQKRYIYSANGGGNNDVGYNFINSDFWQPTVLIRGMQGANLNVIKQTDTAYSDSGGGVAIDSSSTSSDIVQFITRILNDTLQTGSWRRGVNNGVGTPNPKLLAMWRDLGLYNTFCLVNGKETDATPWCASFAHWVLKNCGYPYGQGVANAYWFVNNYDKLGFEKINYQEAIAGDICVWDFSHVNFFIEWTDESHNRMRCIGGNQKVRDKSQKEVINSYNNNPETSSDVTLNSCSVQRLKNGVVYRPVRKF